MIETCGFPSMLLFGVYAAAGVALNWRLRRHGPPGAWGFQPEESYTPEGQRLLRLLLRGWGGLRPLFVALLLGLGGGALCLSIGRGGANP